MEKNGIKKLGGVAEWIWLKEDTVNQYAEFYQDFEIDSESAKLLISAPTNYVVWINGEYVSGGQYGDYAFYKVYDEIDLSNYVKKGKNSLAILSYNQGEDCYVYYYKTACLSFLIESAGKVVAYSNADTKARLSKIYKSGKMETIHHSLGYVAKLDLTKDDEWKTGELNGFENATVVNPDFTLYPRPLLIPQLIPAKNARIQATGVFKANGGESAGQVAQRAYLSAVSLVNIAGVQREVKDRLPDKFDFDTKGEGDGAYVLVDMDFNRAGYISFDIEVDKDVDVIIATGEHVEDLRVRANISAKRNFAQTFRLKKGRNNFTEYVRRFVGRYMMLYIYTDKFTLYNLGISDYNYPFVKKPTKLKDGLKQKIYDVGAHTLEICMHEHYEDCPGREQALYGQDSRNQMLFGYEVFEGFDVQRENLRILGLSQVMAKDGLVRMTAPGNFLSIEPGVSEKDYGGIPIFALWWVLGVVEYYEKTKDGAFVREMLTAIESTMSAYAKTIREKGLECFPNGDYFNFYEWSEGMEPGTNANAEAISALKDKAPTLDCIPTSLFAFVSKKLSKTFKSMGEKQLKEKYNKYYEQISPLVENFYNEKDGYYYSYIDDKGVGYGKHELTQAHVLYAGTGNKKNHKKIAQELIKRDGTFGRITISNTQIFYEAIINLLGKKGLDWVLDDIEKIFGKMCFDGLTTFPEMETGEKVFEEAGSMCHGWSAIGCYFYSKYLLKR